MKVVLKTPRLLLRKMTQEDIPSLARILKDEQTMYAYEGAFNDEEVQQWFDKIMLSYKTYGFGLWAVVLKDTGNMIGQCGLTVQHIDGRDVIEVGYLFEREYWHRGYAIEAAKSCKEHAFNELQLDELYTIIRDNNYASMNVAIRNGMLVRGMILKHYKGVDMPHYIFSIKKRG
ncbi:MAG: GNAT family N-acetyltransferase [Clostridioides sp.]|jgi:RimJ/RimL family protein N-acetyltransferase|nr:GNAT family N-acetyltransferase [Clostridioides sp.]